MQFPLQVILKNIKEIFTVVCFKQFKQHGRVGEPQDSEWELAPGWSGRRRLIGGNTLVCKYTIEYEHCLWRTIRI